MNNKSATHQDQKQPNRTWTLDEWLQRIWKYKLHYVIVLPALLYIFIFKLIPFFTALYMPFVDYKIFNGLLNSSWVGMDNFKQLFDAPMFRQIIANTLIIKFSYIIISGITAFVLTLALSIIRSGKLRNTLSTLVLIPYFVPSVVFAYAVMMILSPSQSPIYSFDKLVLADPSLIRPILVIVEVIKTCGIPVLIALAAIAARHSGLAQGSNNLTGRQSDFVHMNIVPALRAIVAFMLLQFSTILTTDVELISSFVNPLVYKTGDTLDTFMYRTGLMQAQFSVAAALWLLKFLVQLLFTVLAYLLVRGAFLKDLFSHVRGATHIQAENKGGSLAGTVITLIYLIVALVPLYVLFIHPFMVSSSSDIGIGDLLSNKTVIIYFVIGIIAMIFQLGMTVTLAYPLTVKDLPGRSIYKAFLLFILVLGPMGLGSIHEYLFIKDLGMVNTYFPQLFYGIFSIINVFVLKSIFNSKYDDLKLQASENGRGELHTFFTLFIPKIWKPLIALGVLQWIWIWNSYYSTMINTSNPNNFSPVLVFRSLTMGANAMEIPPGDPVIMKLGAIISLPSILLLLIFRKWLTSGVMLGQIRKL